jgi:hypothetical protein
MAFKIRASRRFCCPTIALNGNVAIFALSSSVQHSAGLRRSFTSLGMIPYDKIHGYCMLSHGFKWCQKSACLRDENWFLITSHKEVSIGPDTTVIALELVMADPENWVLWNLHPLL